MKKAALDEVFRDYYGKGEDQPIKWPEGAEEQTRLARELLGFLAVRWFETGFESARDQLRDPQPKRPWGNTSCDIAVRDAALRKVFSTLNDDQKHAVLELVRDQLQNLIFGVFCTLDDFPFGQLHVSLSPQSDDDDDDECEQPPEVKILPHELNLHVSWVSWTRRFSSVAEIVGPALWDADVSEPE